MVGNRVNRKDSRSYAKLSQEGEFNLEKNYDSFDIAGDIIQQHLNGYAWRSRTIFLKAHKM